MTGTDLSLFDGSRRARKFSSSRNGEFLLQD